MSTLAAPPFRILLVDDDEAAGTLLAEVLGREGYAVVTAQSAAEAFAAFGRQGPFDAVLTDLRMPEASGLDLLAQLKARDPDALVMVLTAFGDAATAGEAIRAGAYDFISKPFDLDELRATIARAIERRRFSAHRPAQSPDVAAHAAAIISRGGLVGHSPGIIDVMKQVARVASSQATVLIRGETGTGKELVARTVHRFSERAGKRMVAVNCSALAEGLLESELFGHVRGAFTGATGSRPGLFRDADGGTVFLDEIGDISSGLQARLLRVLQEQEIVPVGSETVVKVDVRIIAATHRDLSQMVREGRFREDLYYRLNVVTITLPPLRERRQDIPLLIDHFLTTLATRHGRDPVAIAPEAQARLLAYDWPGNVRELENALERAIVLAELDVIGPEHLSDAVRPTPGNVEEPAKREVGTNPVPPEEPLVTLEELERRHVFRALASTGGNREATAKVLGISRRTLTRMIQRWHWSPGQT
ncbi:MAG: sigma-54 dependent transcriptional regulator [Gemmatimonadales bacterium]